MRLQTFFLIICICTLFNANSSFGQSVPGKDENIPYLVTFSQKGETKWGDDDYSQAWFFVVPKEKKEPFFIRVFDPDLGGEIDEIQGVFDSKTKFSVLGGKGTFSHPDASKDNPVGMYKSGTLLYSKTFGNQSDYDNKWYNFGPFNPSEGEYIEELGGYIFKIVADGLTGDDGNLYKYFLSTSSEENKPIEGGNVFTYEYTFRIHDKPGSISHIYPFVNELVVAVNINIFDLDEDCYMRLVSVAKKGEKILGSGENQWSKSTHPITEVEKKTSLDVQIIKSKEKTNNNVVISITNQYGKLLPFYAVPIGGVPRYKYSIGVKK